MMRATGLERSKSGQGLRGGRAEAEHEACEAELEREAGS